MLEISLTTVKVQNWDKTLTTMPVYAGDTTISVESTGVGFPDEYGILSIDDELIIYTGKTASPTSSRSAVVRAAKRQVPPPIDGTS